MEVHFCRVKGVCVVCTAAAPAHHLGLSRASDSLGGLAHTRGCVSVHECVCVVCSGLATTQDPDCTLGRAPS